MKLYVLSRERLEAVLKGKLAKKFSVEDIFADLEDQEIDSNSNHSVPINFNECQNITVNILPEGGIDVDQEEV